MLNNVEHIGYLKLPFFEKQLTEFYGESDGTKIDGLYAEYDPNFEKIPVHLTHGYIRSTWDSILKQFKLFDQYSEPENPPEEIYWAKDQLVAMLKGRVSTHVRELDDVEFNFSSTSGFGYQQYYGFKEEYLLNHQEEVDAYWNLAHLLNTKVLWKVSGKEEYLKFKKIDAKDQRCFEIPPVVHQAYTARLCQHFNVEMDKLFEETPIALGVSYIRGGFDRMIKTFMNEFDVFGMGDVSKWDKTFWTYLRKLCLQIRIELIDHEEESERALIASKLKHNYQESIETFCLLPWKQVVKLKGCMKSGDGTTTNDNTLGHMMILLAYIKREIPHVSNYIEAFRIMNFKVYSDDHIFCTTSQTFYLSDFNRRERFYREAGMILKKEDDIVSRDITDLTFLGAKIVNFHGIFVPLYDASRVWSAIVFLPGKDPSVEIKYARLYSYALLLAFDKEALLPIIRYMEWMVKKFPRLDLMTLQTDATGLINLPGAKRPIIPTIGWLQQQWTGLESIMEHLLPSVHLGSENRMPRRSRRSPRTNRVVQSVIAQNNRENRQLKSITRRERRTNTVNRQRPRIQRTLRVTVNRGGRRVRLAKNLHQERNTNTPTAITESRTLEGPAIGEGYDRFAKTNNLYFQTLYHPFTCRGVGVPDTDLSTLKLAVDLRLPVVTDSNGYAFITFGCGRGQGTNGYSLASACSFIPNSYQTNDIGGNLDVFHGFVGNYNSVGSVVDVNNIFDVTKMTPYRFAAFDPNNSDNLFDFVRSMRLVSAGISCFPLGELAAQKGTMTMVQVPKGEFGPDRSLTNMSFVDLANTPGNVIIPMNKLAGVEGIWKPTDLTAYEFVENAENGGWINIQHDDCYDQGAIICLFANCEPGEQIYVTLSLNLEATSESTVFQPSITTQKSDSLAIDQAKDYLSELPWTFLRADFAQTGNMQPASQTESFTCKPFAYYLPNHFHLNGEPKHRRTICGTKVESYANVKGIKETASKVIRAVESSTPMLKRIITEYLPTALKVGGLVASVL